MALQPFRLPDARSPGYAGRRTAAPPRTAPPPPPPSALDEYLRLMQEGPDYSDVQAPLTDDEIWRRVDQRIQPFTQAATTNYENTKRYSGETFDRTAAAARDFGSVMTGLLQGGQTGVEGALYARDNFGNPFLGAVAGSMAKDLLSRLTADFNAYESKILAQLNDYMGKIPEVREELYQQVQEIDLKRYEQGRDWADEKWENRVKAAAVVVDIEQQMAQTQAKASEAQQKDRQAQQKRNDALLNRAYKLYPEALEQFPDNPKRAAQIVRDFLRSSGYTGSLPPAFGGSTTKDIRSESREETRLRQAQARVEQANERLRLQQQKAAQGQANTLRKEQRQAKDSAYRQAKTMSQITKRQWVPKQAEDGTWAIVDTGKKYVASTSTAKKKDQQAVVATAASRIGKLVGQPVPSSDSSVESVDNTGSPVYPGAAKGKYWADPSLKNKNNKWARVFPDGSTNNPALAMRTQGSLKEVEEAVYADVADELLAVGWTEARIRSWVRQQIKQFLGG